MLGCLRSRPYRCERFGPEERAAKADPIFAVQVLSAGAPTDAQLFRFRQQASLFQAGPTERNPWHFQFHPCGVWSAVCCSQIPSRAQPELCDLHSGYNGQTSKHCDQCHKRTCTARSQLRHRTQWKSGSLETQWTQRERESHLKENLFDSRNVLVLRNSMFLRVSKGVSTCLNMDDHVCWYSVRHQSSMLHFP